MGINGLAATMYAPVSKSPTDYALLMMDLFVLFFSLTALRGLFSNIGTGFFFFFPEQAGLMFIEEVVSHFLKMTPF